jgi:apolipoprotein D and lipocalin family protein
MQIALARDRTANYCKCVITFELSVLMKKLMLFLISMLSAITGCTGLPNGAQPVTNFDLNRYLGTWYEIARLDHRFERGLSNVSATYTLRNDGGIDVLNRGYDKKAGKWKEAVGRAYFIGPSTVGSLKVSFFGPFYGGYHVIALDEDHYSYAMVCGPNRSYLWILARNRELDKTITDALISAAKKLEFITDEFIFVEHDPDFTG